MKKVYKISYGNFFNYIFSQILLCINNIFTFFIAVIPIIWLYGEMESVFSNDNIVFRIIATLMVSSIIILSIVLFVFSFIPKKVVVDSDFVTIKRYMLNFSYLFRGFNDKIYIKDIVDCRIYEGERYRLYRSGPYTVFFFDWNDLVELKTRNKTYLVPIKNADSFVLQISNEIMK